MATLVAIAAVAFGAGGAAGGNGSTVLRGTFDTYGIFSVNGSFVFYTFTCDEQRVQRPDGSASESARCQLDAGQTPPTSAGQMVSGYISDFWFFGPVPGFAGGVATFDDQGVVTPSGSVNFSANYPAP